MELGNEQHIQPNVHHGADSQKNQRDQGISHRAQEKGIVIVQEDKGKPHQNHPDIVVHQIVHVRRGLHPVQNGIQQDERDTGQCGGDGQNQHKGGGQVFPHGIIGPAAAADGQQRPRTHAHSDDQRRQKGHQGVGAAHSTQGSGTQIFSHNPGIGQIVALLQHIAQNHGQGKNQHGFGNRAGG